MPPLRGARASCCRVRMPGRPRCSPTAQNRRRRYGSAVTETARAFWVREPGRGEIRPAPLRAPGPGEALVRTRFSALSPGTEGLVFRGGVPESEHERMRAPFQEGDFPAPVKYGYLSVGIVDEGPDALQGRTVFCLHPHQTAYVVPADALTPVPDGVPARRAVLAGIVETAVNALWDVPPRLGDRIAVVGGGLVGCCLTRLLTRVPGTRVTLVDVDPARSEIAAALGASFASPADAPADQDIVYHASASAGGLQRSLDLLRTEGTVVELSWYGDQAVNLRLGGVFHSRRLTIRSSQVGLVAPAQRSSRSTRDRLALALDLLTDPKFDVLLTGSSPFDELPQVLLDLVAGRLPALGHTITYEEG
jgi:NADPH:quinone reductase-like Zn-dependent oxidoreductase